MLVSRAMGSAVNPVKATLIRDVKYSTALPQSGNGNLTVNPYVMMVGREYRRPITATIAMAVRALTRALLKPDL
jgi:hypothetical protein